MRLARPAEPVTLGEVVPLTEPHCAIVGCFCGHASCRLDGPCALAGTLDKALAALRAVHDRHSLADVAAAAGTARQRAS
jgi:Rrf2 family nitric oxide-sensitive transcriptional repressor